MPWSTKELTSTPSINSGKIRTSQSLLLKNCAIFLTVHPMMCSLSNMKKICNTVIVWQYFYGGISVYGRAAKRFRRSNGLTTVTADGTFLVKVRMITCLHIFCIITIFYIPKKFLYHFYLFLPNTYLFQFPNLFSFQFLFFNPNIHYISFLILEIKPISI